MIAKRRSCISTPNPPTPGSAKRHPPVDVRHLPFVLLGFLLRLVPLGRYVTPDEPAWVYRAIRFADALAARTWTAIPITGHPGVTTMWLGSIGVIARKLLDPSGSAIHLDFCRRTAWLAPENGEAFRHLAFFLPPGRVAVALVTTLGLSILYWLLTRLFGRRTALLTVGMLACDPFLTGHSGLLHTDALLATFSLLALAAGLNGLQEPRQVAWWALTGVFTGLALLTKTPALALVPFVILIIAIGNLRAATHHRRLPAHPVPSATSHVLFFVLHSSIFVVAAAAILFALYPALWSHPAETLRTLSTFVVSHVEMAQRPIFFAGRMAYDPGWAFYPVVLLFRISPIVLVGLGVGLINLGHLPGDRRLALLLLLTFAVGFGAMMSLGAKKHDRYLLPAIPPLTLACAISADWAIGRLTDRYTGESDGQHPTWLRFTNIRITNSLIYGIIPLALQALLALAFLLHPLTYSNPLVGGPWTAAHMLPPDWGEGMGAAARWLNQLPGAQQLTVAVPSVPPFAALFEGRTLPLKQASLADYLVLDSRQPTHPLSHESVHTVTLGLLPHATIAINTAASEQAAYLEASATQSDLILLDARTPLSRRYAGPSTLVSVADLPDQATLSARLAELRTEHATIWRVTDPAASPITARHLRLALDAIATPVSSATVASATITRYVVRNTSHAIGPNTYANFGNQIALIGATLPGTPVNASFPICLRWLVPTPTPASLTASLQLRDPARHLWAEVGQLIHNTSTFPTAAWTPWEWADNTLALRPPDRIPPGVYTVEVVVTDETGAQLGAWNADDQFQGVRVPLGDVRIDPPGAPSGQSLCKDGRSVAAGPLLACLPDMPAQAIPSGDGLTLALTWSSTTSPGSDFQARWRLAGAGDGVVMTQTGDVSPYATSSWRKGDSFETRHDLRIEPSLPAGQYTLTLNVLAPDGRPLWAQDESVTTIEVLPRDRLFELPGDIAHPLDLTLGRAVHLRGYDLAHTRATPGDTLSVTLFWRAGGPTDIDYTVFVHLVGPDGRPHGQVDYFPAGGAAPTTSWARDQVIVDEIALPVADDAPAGTYHVVVGMYDAVSGGRLPIVDAERQSLPNAQAILPPEITISGDHQ
jgi:hypothetical protein